MKLNTKVISVLLISLLLSFCFLPFTKVEAMTRSENAVMSMLEPGIYLIKNKASGKYLNVNLGTDANGTNVIQWSYDGSIEQKWKVVEVNGKYKLYAMCSSNGNNRVLDVLRENGSASGAIKPGCNVDIWEPNDPDAQTWSIYEVYRAGQYVIDLQGLGLLLTVSDNNNGSGVGTLPTSQGNVYIDDYGMDIYDNQIWFFERIG